MTIYEIRVIAKKMGIEPKKKNKADLIKTIQIKEGNTPCFKTAVINCNQEDCCWRRDCLK
jgi:predicted metal-binding transcription factor (methanogenesis marker protein 9)